LITNSLFCSAACFLVVKIGHTVLRSYPAGLLSGFLCMTNFQIGNIQLAGYVDSSELFSLVALTGALLWKKWWLLPVIGVAGTLCKDTVFPLSTALMLGWLSASKRTSRRTLAAWIIATVLLS